MDHAQDLRMSQTGVPPNDWHSARLLARWFGWSLWSCRARDSQLLHAKLQRGPLDAEARSRPIGAGEDPVGLLQDRKDVLPLHFLKRGEAIPIPISPLRRAGLEIAEGNLEQRALGKDDRSLDDILQLPDVARPGVTNQRVHGFRRDGVDLLGHIKSKVLREMTNKERYIVSALAQWRNVNGKDVQSIKQIGAELLFFDHRMQITIGRSDQASIGAKGA